MNSAPNSAPPTGMMIHMTTGPANAPKIMRAPRRMLILTAAGGLGVVAAGGLVGCGSTDKAVKSNEVSGADASTLREPVARPTPTNPSGNAGLMGLAALDLFDALESRGVVTNGEFVRVLVAMGGEEPPTNYRSALKLVAARGWIGDDFPSGADEPVNIDRAAAALAKAAGIDLPAGTGVALGALQKQGWLGANAGKDGVLSGAELLGAAGALLDRKVGVPAPAAKTVFDDAIVARWLGGPEEASAAKWPKGPSVPRWPSEQTAAPSDPLIILRDLSPESTPAAPAAPVAPVKPEEEEESFDGPAPAQAKPPVPPPAPASPFTPPVMLAPTTQTPTPTAAVPAAAPMPVPMPVPVPAPQTPMKAVRSNFPKPRPEPLPVLPVRKAE